MAIKRYKPYTPSRRHMTVSAFDEITKSTPEKSLVVHLKKNSGRNNQGKLTVRHRGGGPTLLTPKMLQKFHGEVISWRRLQD